MSTTTNLDTLKINYLTQAQYDRAVSGGTINADELYFTPDESTSGGNAKIFYGTSSTGASTGTKVVTCDEFTSSDLVKGAIIFVTFDYSNTATASNIKLNVNNTGAIGVRQIMNGEKQMTDPTASSFIADETYWFAYDGTHWVCDAHISRGDLSKQLAAITTSGAYPIMLGANTNTTLQTGALNKGRSFTYNPSTKALATGGSIDGYTLARACAKGVDTSISDTTSTNLPTTAAVVAYINSLNRNEVSY